MWRARQARRPWHDGTDSGSLQKFWTGAWNCDVICMALSSTQRNDFTIIKDVHRQTWLVIIPHTSNPQYSWKKINLSMKDPTFSQMNPWTDNKGSKCPPVLASWTEYCFLPKASVGLWCVNPKLVHAIITHQSGRSPKVVALFPLQTLAAILYDYLNCIIQSK